MRSPGGLRQAASLWFRLWGNCFGTELVGTPAPYYHGEAVTELPLGASSIKKRKKKQKLSEEAGSMQPGEPPEFGESPAPRGAPISPPQLHRAQQDHVSRDASSTPCSMNVCCLLYTSSIHAHLEADKDDDALSPRAVPLLSLPSYRLLAPSYRVVFGETRTRFP